MRKSLLAVAAMLALAAFTSPFGHAATRCNDKWELHGGSKTMRASCGPRVKDVQWLLAGHRPNVMRQIKPTFKAAPNGLYGARTKAAVTAYKYRLGYPHKGECRSKANMAGATQVGPQFFAILEGKVKRPTCWVALAAARVKGAVRTGMTTDAARIKALEVAQLGVHEIPNGSNRGPRISYTSGGYGPYQGATGAYGLAWCASFQQWAFMNRAHYGRFANNSAYVPYIAQWAQRYNHLAAKPKVGSLVVFLTSNLLLVDSFHIGFVVRVTATGVQTIEGNYANGVHEVWRPYASNHMVYVDIPGVA